MAGRCTEGARKEAENVFIQQHSDSAEFICLEEPPHTPVQRVNPGQLPKTCCHHGNPGQDQDVAPNRKFILSFQCMEGSGSPEEECIMRRAREKCREFWAFVDQDPNLTRWIRPGVPMPVPEKLPGRATKTAATEVHKTNSEMIREGQMQPLEIRNKRLKDRERLEKMKKTTLLLQERSGQRPFKAPPKKEKEGYKDVFADAVSETWDDAVQAMMDYDAKKA